MRIRTSILLLLSCLGIDGFSSVSKSRSTFPALGYSRRNNKNERELEFPEQYPATYELNDYKTWKDFGDAAIVRPLLKQTQLERRNLKVAYDANKQGWNAQAFHRAVDGEGAAVILARGRRGGWLGGYNPKGWSSNGGARPSVAAFLFYTTSTGKWQKLQKVGGGGLACAKDDPNTGIWLGADGLVIPLAQKPTLFPTKEAKMAQSFLGTYFERGPERKLSLFPDGCVMELSELKVLVGVYERGEEIPYSGAVLDFTSG
ncbi:hypothetical protein FisN_13Hh300 [Fistulifera solaris]|uniref:TLDc domain-containing protein n=1 Tax=Fistulifera solaris TaxID=1519565 RepID=A0A1Z5KNM2_FISSO|nr:hypothetical protein FisN_13Hh300 [Fistulifera solaris]|eukprot:GAX27611.1 hypothetical protein FisN_13Hh300 [Fistulifera solaris]